MKKAVLIIFFLITTGLYAQSESLYRFYDFEIEIDFHHGLLHDGFKIIFPNGFKYDHLKKNSLYRINYTYDQDLNRIATDTLRTELNKEQMNKLFKLTSNQFNFKFSENLSKDKIPPPPTINDGLVAYLTLDLVFRDDVYKKELSFPYGDKTFRELSDYIEKLINDK